MPSSLRLKYETKRFRQPDYAFVPLALSENERNGGGFARYIRRILLVTARLLALPPRGERDSGRNVFIETLPRTYKQTDNGKQR